MVAPRVRGGQGEAAVRRNPTRLSRGGNEGLKGGAAFVKPHPQAVGDRCAADGFADHGMDGSRCRPAMGRGEPDGQRAKRAAAGLAQGLGPSRPCCRAHKNKLQRARPRGGERRLCPGAPSFNAARDEKSFCAGSCLRGRSVFRRFARRFGSYAATKNPEGTQRTASRADRLPRSRRQQHRDSARHRRRRRPGPSGGGAQQPG